MCECLWIYGLVIAVGFDLCCCCVCVVQIFPVTGIPLFKFLRISDVFKFVVTSVGGSSLSL
jgi:hypothetical protein